MATPSPRTIYLIRHAKAQAMGSVEDHLRQLTPLGRKEAVRMGKALRHSEPAITAIYASPYTRCVQTARRLADGLGLTILVEPALDKSAAPIDPALSFIQPTSGAVVLISHHETIPPLLDALTGEQMAHDPPTYVIRMERTGPLSAEVAWQSGVDDLKRIVKWHAGDPRQHGEDTDMGRREPLQFAGGGGHWITLHAEDSDEGTVHVFISAGGRITKGPAALVGHAIGHLSGHKQTHHPEGHEPTGARSHPHYEEKKPNPGKPYARTDSAREHTTKEGAEAALKQARAQLKGNAAPEPETPAVTPPAAKTPPPSTAQAPTRSDSSQSQARIVATPDDLSYDVAYRAWATSSHTPEDRAKTEQKEAARVIQGVYEDLLKRCTNDEQRAILDSEIERYKQNYLAKYTAILHRRASIASSFITGPANFPTRTMQKRNDADHKATGEFLAWDKTARLSMAKKITAARTDDEIASAEKRQLGRSVASNLATIRMIDQGDPQWRGFDKSAFVNSIVGKTTTMANAGKVDAVAHAHSLVRDYNAANSKPAITERHKFWGLLDVAHSKTAERRDAETHPRDQGVLGDYEHGRVVLNPDLDRIQIVFHGKPDEATRADLRSSGWNWSPSNGAWQRKVTENAKYSARTIMERHKPAADSSITAPTGGAALKDTHAGEGGIQQAKAERTPEEHARLQDERADLEEEGRHLEHVRDFISEHGGIRADRKASVGKAYRHEEWERLPHWAKNSGSSMTMDDMARVLEQDMPGLGVHDNNTLSDYLERHTARHKDVQGRLAELKGMGIRPASGGGRRRQPVDMFAHQRNMPDFTPQFEGDVGFTEHSQEPPMDTSRRFDQPSSSSLHVNAPIGATSGGDGTPASAKRKRIPNRMLRQLVKGLRGHMGEHGYLDADALESHVRKARSHSGGMAKAERRRAAAAGTQEYAEGNTVERPDGWKGCKKCKKGKTDKCTCPGCTAGKGCWCCHNHKHAEPERKANVFSDSGEGFRLFLPISKRFADAPEWSPYLPKPGTFTHPRYGKIEITATRNEEFVKNFNTGVYQKQIPLDGEHQTKLSGALGWVQELRLNQDGSADARVEWTGRGRTMLSDNRFKYISPEWYDSWQDPATGQTHANVVIGGALTTRPYFKESALRPLVAAEDAIYIDGDDTPFSPNGQENTSMSKQNTEHTDGTGTDDQAKTFAEQIAALQAENATLKQASEQAASDAKQAAEQVAAMQADKRRQQFGEMAREWYGPTSDHVSFMESLDDEQLAFYAKQQRAYAEQLRDSALFSQFGRTGGADDGSNSAEGRLDAEAKKIMASENIGYSAAYTRALEQNPKLYAEIDAAAR